MGAKCGFPLFGYLPRPPDPPFNRFALSYGQGLAVFVRLPPVKRAIRDLAINPPVNPAVHTFGALGQDGLASG